MTRLFRLLRPSRPMTALALSIAVVTLALTIPAAVAQSSRKLPPGLASANVAINEGRYEEVATLTAQLDAQDPAVVAVRARALIARGRYDEAIAALQPAAARAPASEAALELGLLQQMLSRPEARDVLTRVASRALSATDPTEMARGARALQALNQFEDAQAAFRDAASAAPRDPAINTAWGEFFLERQCQTCNTEAVKSFQVALEQDPRYVPAIFGLTRAVANDNPPAAIGTARKILEINPSHVETHLFLAGQAADAGKRDEARQLIQKALAVNPSSLDAHSLLAALAYVEDKTPEFEAQVGQGAGDVAGIRRGLPRGRGIHGSRVPLRRGGDARPARARHRPAAPAGARRSRDVPAPHRRRGRRAQRARSLLQAEPVRRRHLQPARDDGHARHVHHRRAGRRSCCGSTRPTPRCSRQRRWNSRAAPSTP